MLQLSDFPITRKWPARHPERLERYSLATPNGVKVSILREEIGPPCEAHVVGFDNFPEVQQVLASLVARPAVVAGLEIPKAAA